MPSTVSGFTKQEAPAAGVVPSGSTRQCAALMARNCAYIAPPNRATVLPRSACASVEAPALTTTPAPSLPTGIGWSTRPTTAGISRGGIRAVTTGWSAGPATWTVLRSAGPKSRPRSDGLIGAASTRTTTGSVASFCLRRFVVWSLPPTHVAQEGRDDGDQLQRGAFPSRHYSDGGSLVCRLP